MSTRKQGAISVSPMCLDEMIGPDYEVKAIDAIVDCMEILGHNKQILQWSPVVISFYLINWVQEKLLEGILLFEVSLFVLNYTNFYYQKKSY